MAYTLLKDGWQTLITITGVDTTFEEIEITPPALDSTGTIDQTTMRNSRLRTALGKALMTLTACSIKVAYDPKTYAEIYDHIGKNRACVVRFPDGATLTFYAIVDSFKPDALKEGDRPEGTLELTPSNLTTASPPVEVAPVFATGTTATTTTTTLVP